MNRKVSGVFVATCTAVGLAAFPVLTSANHSWGSYHWARTSNPFTLKLGDNLTSAWDPYLSVASVDWTASAVLNTTIVAGTVTNPKTCKATAGMVQVCNAKYGFNGWLGIASISASGSHITAGTVKMNDSYYNTATYNTPAWRQMVLCQELGHIFGLDHQDDVFDNPNLGTCMDYTNDPSTNQHPNNHDYVQLETIYSHLDSTTTVSQAAAGGPGRPASAQGDGFGTAQWGRLIRSTNGGRTELFELDLGGGHKVFTFVVWADDAD